MADKKKEDYAYTPSDAVSTWKLDISDRAHVIAAKAALSKGGFRGQRVQIPKDDLPAVIRKVNKACKKFDLEPIPTDEDKRKKSMAQSDELKHFGVKGMKWGIRRAEKRASKIAAKFDKKNV